MRGEEDENAVTPLQQQALEQECHYPALFTPVVAGVEYASWQRLLPPDAMVPLAEVVVWVDPLDGTKEFVVRFSMDYFISISRHFSICHHPRHPPICMISNSRNQSLFSTFSGRHFGRCYCPGRHKRSGSSHGRGHSPTILSSNLFGNRRQCWGCVLLRHRRHRAPDFLQSSDATSPDRDVIAHGSSDGDGSRGRARAADCHHHPIPHERAVAIND